MSCTMQTIIYIAPASVYALPPLQLLDFMGVMATKFASCTLLAPIYIELKPVWKVVSTSSVIVFVTFVSLICSAAKA